MPTQTVISINRQTPIMGPATFYPRVVVERLLLMGMLSMPLPICLWNPKTLFSPQPKRLLVKYKTNSPSWGLIIYYTIAPFTLIMILA